MLQFRSPAGQDAVQHPVDIPFDASDAHRAALDRVGRTEAVKFSPDNRRLALASLDRNAITIVDLDITTNDARPVIAVTGVAELSAPGLAYPHGVDFFDDDTIVVANRSGGTAGFRLPPADGADLTPIDPDGRGFELQHGPSALATTRRADGDTEVLIGHHDAGILTRHVVRRDDSSTLTVTANEVLLRRGVENIDGVAVSADGNWIAVTNPWHQQVLLYATSSALDEHSDPVGILRGACVPARCLLQPRWPLHLRRRRRQSMRAHPLAPGRHVARSPVSVGLGTGLGRRRVRSWSDQLPGGRSQGR